MNTISFAELDEWLSRQPELIQEYAFFDEADAFEPALIGVAAVSRPVVGLGDDPAASDDQRLRAGPLQKLSGDPLPHLIGHDPQRRHHHRPAGQHGVRTGLAQRQDADHPPVNSDDHRCFPVIIIVFIF